MRLAKLVADTEAAVLASYQPPAATLEEYHAREPEQTRLTDATPPLLPGSALDRARVRAFAQAICCDIHPVQNLNVLARLRAPSFPEGVTGWVHWVIQDGLGACETLLAEEEGPFLFGPTSTLADICLVPQLGIARRFGADLTAFTRIIAAAQACAIHPAFIAAGPESQPNGE